MKLIGSTTSPFVRRLRLFLDGVDYQFLQVDIFNPSDRASLIKENPTLKIPMLKDGEQVIFDSGLIYRYLVAKLGSQALSWDQQNALVSIDSVNDALVNMFIIERSGIDNSQDKMYFNIQRERAVTVFTYLDKLAEQGMFEEWNYLAICLYCLLDCWAGPEEEGQQFYQQQVKEQWRTRRVRLQKGKEGTEEV